MLEWIFFQCYFQANEFSLQYMKSISVCLCLKNHCLFIKKKKRNQCLYYSISTDLVAKIKKKLKFFSWHYFGEQVTDTCLCCMVCQWFVLLTLIAADSLILSFCANSSFNWRLFIKTFPVEIQYNYNWNIT